jgi:CheY-like chemotaxis protein
MKGIAPEFAEARERVSRKVFETGEKQILEFPIQTPAGERFLECRFIPELAPDGSVETLMTLTRDVTERKRAEARLKGDPDAMSAVCASMERQTLQLITLVEDLMDVSRITRGRLQLRMARVALADVVHSAVETSKPQIDAARHELTVTLPEYPLYVDADPFRLSQVLSNLLNNAAKYTPEGGQIRLSAERSADEIVLSVEDSGIGIPADMLERVFEMFTQIDRPLEKGQTGLGIGLTLVQSLVEMHGGRVRVRSEGENRGSTFSVHLPIPTGMPAADSTPVATAEGNVLRGARRVLVVDDNDAAADMLAMMVEMLGHDVRTANDGQQALQVGEEFRPEVVLMDLGMPRMNGYEAATRMRATSWGKHAALIALTGWGQEEAKQRTEEAGFDHHLVKPANPDALQAILADPSAVSRT